MQFVSGDAAAAPRQAVLALRTLVVAAAIIHRAVSGCLSCTTAHKITYTFTHLHIIQRLFETLLVGQKATFEDVT